MVNGNDFSDLSFVAHLACDRFFFIVFFERVLC